MCHPRTTLGRIVQAGSVQLRSRFEAAHVELGLTQSEAFLKDLAHLHSGRGICIWRVPHTHRVCSHYLSTALFTTVQLFFHFTTRIFHAVPRCTVNKRWRTHFVLLHSRSVAQLRMCCSNWSVGPGAAEPWAEWRYCPLIMLATWCQIN